MAERLEIVDLKARGLDLNLQSRNSLGNKFSFEAPARTNRASFSGQCHVGAFTYFADGRIYTTDIGRYCSVASGVVIGQTNHPTRWLSTNPFQYQQSYRFNTALSDGFAHKADYEHDQVDPQLTRKAHAEVLRRTTIGHDVWIGNGAIILAGVTIGDGAIIGAGAVITKNVAPYDIIGGIPGKKIGERFDDATKARLITSQWWEYAPWQLRHIDFSDVNAAVEDVMKMRSLGVDPYRPEIVQAH